MDSSLTWKTISFAPNYKISENGDIYSKFNARVLKPYINTYKRIKLRVSDKILSFLIHRLVATVFIPNPDNKPYVDHIDRNKNNNHFSNLRWVTPAENRNNCDSIVGVYFEKDRNKWRVQFSSEPHVRQIFRFETKKDAQKYRDKITNGTGIIKRDMHGKMLYNINES